MERRKGLRLQLWAFGFDMEDAKARCWYESTVPLYELAACEPEVHTELSQEIANWVSASELAVEELRNAVKKWQFAKEARGDFGFVDASFWSATEAEFYRLLQTRIHAAQAGEVFDRVQAAQRWLEHLLSQALNLFDKQFAGSGLIERENPRRIAAARQKLWAMGDALRMALNLPIESRATGKSISKKRTAQETPTSPKDPPT
jgi:CRISPR system Cascade subunit CasA